MLSIKHKLLLLLLAVCGTLAQFPAEPQGIEVIRSRFNSNVTISYKQNDICEKTPNVKSYSGYVHLPAGSLEDRGEPTEYPINTFFWFFESRKDPQNAPLSIWLNGGPGSSSMFGLLLENGPCWANPDSETVTHNEWSWNNEVNMLYLDQPVQVGFSYDTLQNITRNYVTGEVTLLNETSAVPETNTTFVVGTSASRDANSTAFGSINAAKALWEFAQVWFQEFPGYKPNDDRISLATQSYGGRYGPAFFGYFQEQNERILNGELTEEGSEYLLNLDTLLIVNGCIERLVQWPSYPHIAYNNTYGIETINRTIYESMLDGLYREGGCQDQIYECRNISAAYDPLHIGVNETVNQVCEDAETYCTENVRIGYNEYSGRAYYDIAQLDPASFTPAFHIGFLNQPHVQEALGVPLNFSGSGPQSAAAFRSIGDYNRPGWLEDLADLLEGGVKVSLVHGDRDYACNWIGGEAASLAIEWENSTNFRNAGYESIVTNDSYIGGQVRQYGNLSYVRVYQAGHEIPSYQPETAYRIFMRALFNKDIATGTIDVTAADGTLYSSTGPADTWAIKNQVPDQPLQFCYVLDPSTCTEDQSEMVANGTGEIRDFILVDRNSTELFPWLLLDDRSSYNGSIWGTYKRPVPHRPVESIPQPLPYAGSASRPRIALLASGTVFLAITALL